MYRPTPSSVRFLIDRCEYFECVREMLMCATQEVLISGWRGSSFLTLLRGEGVGRRLSELLLDAAKRGVRVRVLLWDESEVAFAADPQIRFARVRPPATHPAYRASIQDHHKFIVVDRRRALVGGVHVGDNLSRCPGVEHYVSEVAADPSAAPTARVDWHDVAVYFSGPLAEDVATVVFDRMWRFHAARWWRPVVHALCSLAGALAALSCGGHAASHASVDPGPEIDSMSQVVASFADWVVPRALRANCLEAWVRLIRAAERYVYIELQCIDSGDNHIVHELLERFADRLAARSPLLMFIVVPMPAIDARRRSASHAELHIYRRNAEALMRADGLYARADQVARKHGIRASRYISICSLQQVVQHPRTGRFATSRISVHSRVLIVDGAAAVIGSANGVGDTELALEIHGDVVDDLARQLMEKHYGEALMYPLDSGLTLEQWSQRADRNAGLLLNAFPHMPSDRFRTLDVYQRQAVEPGLADPRLRGVCGHLVTHPHAFLADETAWLLGVSDSGSWRGIPHVEAEV